MVGVTGNNLPVDALGPRTEIGSGGQGTVYAVPRTINRSWPVAYKAYNTATLATLDIGALEAMVGYLDALPYAVGRDLCDRAAWPAAVVEEHTTVTGFLMRRIAGEFKPRMRWPAGYREALGQVQFLLNNDQYLAARELPVHDRFRLEFLRDTAETLELFHGLQIAVGDLSPNNLLFSLSSRPRCFFIDCDAMRVRGRSVMTAVETADWQVPAGEELATDHSDAYKFGLLAIRLFAGDQSARDPDVLSRVAPELAALASRSLSTTPGQRPKPADWLAPLDAAIPAASLSLPGQPPGHVVWTVGAGTGTPPHGYVPVPGYPPVARPPQSPPRLPVATRPPARPGYRRGQVRALVTVALIGLGVWIAGPTLAKLTSTGGAPANPGAPAAVATATAAGTGTATGPADDGATQAAAVQRVLEASRTDRARIGGAVSQVAGCGDVSGGLAAFQQASSGRQIELGAARTLDTGALSGGGAVAATLVEALQHSLAADDAFVRWAQAVRDSGCSDASLNNADRHTADAESHQATDAKQRFISAWAPDAQRYGYPVPTEPDI